MRSTTASTRWRRKSACDDRLTQIINRRHWRWNATFAASATGNWQSARGLRYLDALWLGDFSTSTFSTPPRRSMVFPNQLARVDVLYGANCALYPGHTIGATVLTGTRMSDKLELSAHTQLFTQQLDSDGSYRGYDGSRHRVTLGDRVGKLPFLADFARPRSHGQPLVWDAPNVPGTAASESAIPVTGAPIDVGPNGRRRTTLGSNSEGQEATSQNQAHLKLTDDFTPNLCDGLNTGYCSQDLSHRTESYLRDGNDQMVLAGTVAISGLTLRHTSRLFCTEHAPQRKCATSGLLKRIATAAGTCSHRRPISTAARAKDRAASRVTFASAGALGSEMAQHRRSRRDSTKIKFLRKC